jgi:hypothetical protein
MATFIQRIDKFIKYVKKYPKNWFLFSHAQRISLLQWVSKFFPLWQLEGTNFPLHYIPHQWAKQFVLWWYFGKRTTIFWPGTKGLQKKLRLISWINETDHWE